MRLSHLSLRNFRSFRDAEVDFEPATVLVGANDSGKSGLLDAIYWIFSEVDRRGEFYSRAGHAFRSTTTNRGERVDNVAATMSVKATFADLTGREAAIWAPALLNGRVTFGRWLDDDDESGELHVILSQDSRAAMAAFEAARWNAGDELGALAELGDVIMTERGGEFWLSLDDLGQLVVDDELTFWPKPWPDPFADYPSAANVVSMGGPESGAEQPTDILRPIIARAIRARLLADTTDPDPSTMERDVLTAQLIAVTREVVEEVSSSYSRVLPRYTNRAGGAVVFQSGSTSGLTSKLIDLAIGQISVDLLEGDQESTEVTASSLGHRVEDLGAGTRHAAALAVLELFRDPNVWPVDQSVVLLVEEPEMGLHPGAQRQVISALRALSTFGVQLVLVTHAAAFVNAVPVEGLRLVRGGDPWGVDRAGSAVLVPNDLSEIARDLAVSPADVLLARRFLVVEGDSDGGILRTWARTLGVPLDETGVRIVPAHGHGSSSMVARFLEIAYEGASFWIVLDQGRETAKNKLELENRFGGRVTVRLLGRTEIEAYLSAPAVERWLASQGIAIDTEVEQVVRERLAGTARKLALREIARQFLGRDYRVVEDGVAIAGLTREAEIPSEIAGLLNEVAAP